MGGKIEVGGDWQELQELECQVAAGAITMPTDEVHALLRRIGNQVGLARSNVEAGLVDAEKTKELVILLRTTIKRASRRYGEALLEATRLAREGKLGDGRKILAEVAKNEKVRFFADLARTSLDQLGDERNDS